MFIDESFDPPVLPVKQIVKQHPVITMVLLGETPAQFTE